MRLPSPLKFRMFRAARFALGAAAIGALTLAVGALRVDKTAWSGERASATPAAQLAPAVWEEAQGAPRRFRLTDPVFGREPDLYSVRRNVAGGGRLDQMAFGSPSGETPFLRLTFYRPFDEPMSGASFWLEMARRAGEAGLSLERTPPVPGIIATRLGDFEIGALSAQASSGPRACIGFRREQRAPDFVISGIACAGGGVAGVRLQEALACVLDSIALIGPVDDRELAALFAGRNNTACRASAPSG